MVCVCRILSIEDQVHVSAVKLVDLAAACGKPVPAVNKCGGKYFILFILLLFIRIIIIIIIYYHLFENIL